MTSQDYYRLWQELDTIKSLEAANVNSAWQLPLALIIITLIPILIVSFTPVIKWILLYLFLTRHKRKEDNPEDREKKEVIDV